MASVTSESSTTSTPERRRVHGSTRPRPISKVLDLVSIRCTSSRDLIETESRTFEIGRGRVEPWTRLLSGVDVVLDSEVTEAIQVSAGAHRRHATGEIE